MARPPLFLLASTLALASSGFAQSVKLNGELAQPLGGHVSAYLISPDGQWAVYRADQETDELYELFAVPVDGSAEPVKISAPTVPNADVTFFPGFVISDDSTCVAYMLDQGSPRVLITPIDGSSSPVGLDTPTPGISMGDTDPFFRIAPGHQWLLYWNEGEGGIWSAPTDGGTGIPLYTGYVPGTFRFSPDGTRVFYQGLGGEVFNAALDGSGEIPLGIFGGFVLGPDGSVVAYGSGGELFARPSDGTGAPVPLSGSMVAGGALSTFRITPDGARVVYRADQEVDEKFELFSVPIDGSAAPFKVNGPMGPPKDVTSSPAFQLSPDSRWVAYRADEDFNEVFELFAARVDRSGGRRKLSGPMVALGDVSTAFDSIKISPDGRHVVYRADQETDGVNELFSARLEGSQHPRLRRQPPPSWSKLNGPLVAGGNVDFGWTISSDGKWVAYIADQNTDEVEEVYTAPIDGNAPSVKLNEPLDPNADVRHVLFGEGRAVFQAPHTPGFSGQGLFSAPPDGSQSAISIAAPMPAAPIRGDVHRAKLTADGTRAVYLADQDTEDVDELYSVATNGRASPIKLNQPLVLHGDVGTGGFSPLDVFDISPDGTRVAYIADAVVDNDRNLYVVPIHGGTPLELASGGSAQPPVRFSPDGQYVVYLANFAGEDSLYSVRADGSEAPTELSGPIVDFGDVLSFLISPDSTRVVYNADEDNQTGQLFTVPIDGSASRVSLHGFLAAGRGVQDYALSPDGSRVVYTVDDTADNVFDLFSVPIDRGQAPVRLNIPNNPNRDVAGFEIAPDGLRVAYVADEDTDQVFELYSVAIDFFSPHDKLSGPFVAGGNIRIVSDPVIGISPDSSRVVYVADQDTNDVYELYSVPLDGGSPAVKLNDPLPTFGSVGTDPNFFEISSDSGTVVYLADQDTLSVDELYAVPIDGSLGPIKLNAPLFVDGDVKGFAIGPLGSPVVYSADQDTNSVFDLYRVPIDRTREPKRISAIQFGGLVDFRFFPVGRRILYLAEQDAVGVVELYASVTAETRESAPPTGSVSW